MAASRSGTPVYADTAALSRLGRSLRRAAPEVWKAYKVTVTAAAGPLLADMQSRASFSSRIPQSGRIVVTTSGVKIVFDAPDAAPIENRGKGFVRHPLFGDREHWYDKNSHPAFASPALDAHAAPLVGAVEEALTVAVERTVRGGF